VQAVLVATPTNTHEWIVTRALTHGKDVFLWKTSGREHLRCWPLLQTSRESWKIAILCLPEVRYHNHCVWFLNSLQQWLIHYTVIMLDTLLSEMNLLYTAFRKSSLLSFSGCWIKADSFYATGSSWDETQNCFNTNCIQNHYITEITTIHMQVGVQAEYCVNLCQWIMSNTSMLQL